MVNLTSDGKLSAFRGESLTPSSLPPFPSQWDDSTVSSVPRTADPLSLALRLLLTRNGCVHFRVTHRVTYTGVRNNYSATARIAHYRRASKPRGHNGLPVPVTRTRCNERRNPARQTDVRRPDGRVEPGKRIRQVRSRSYLKSYLRAYRRTGTRVSARADV